MLSREFKLSEKILLLLAACMFVGIFYYFVAYQNFQETLTKYDTTALQTELDTAQARMMKYKQMKDKVSEGGETTLGTVEVYNNLAAEVAELGNILNGNATDISISWENPVLTDTTVRRVAKVSFRTGSWEEAKALINTIANCKYRSVISDMQVNKNQSNNDTTVTNVSVSVTFFETSEGAKDLEGLIIPESTATPSVADLAK